MKHYFKPGREDFRQALLKNMPQMMSERARSTVKDEMRELIEKVTAKTWKKDKQRLLELIDSI